ncbi:MAG: fumarylacetoacetate hydrolase family protein [Gemmataceae bacterium]|nr:fumarylacetoacetate hydrolase family protein [Gemmataceae bacterium]
MRLCRYQHNGNVEVAIYNDDSLVPIHRTAAELMVPLPAPSNNVLDYLPPNGRNWQAVQQFAETFRKLPAAEQRRLSRPTKEARLRVPIPEPKKVILLAGNYAAHIIEGGGQAVERAETFPYFFWKPPSTTLTDPGAPIVLPRVSPHHIDWEVELGVVIGRKARHVTEKEALSCVAGYTICNDVSDRRFQINPKRKPREKDRYFDWLHGKWHDTFLPVGPCVRAATAVPDPQKLRLSLRVNGKVMQDASTAQMIFPVAALISILSDFITLEPGDLIVTGTPEGVGHARKPPIYLRPGDEVVCEIEGIGVLRNPVEAEKAVNQG